MEMASSSTSKGIWAKLVWFKGAIHKHSIICWLAMLNRLSTRDRKIKYNALLNPTCSFCNLDESRDHLFFNCVFSSLVLRIAIVNVGKAGNIPTDWAAFVTWGIML